MGSIASLHCDASPACESLSPLYLNLVAYHGRFHDQTSTSQWFLLSAGVTCIAHCEVAITALRADPVLFDNTKRLTDWTCNAHLLGYTKETTANVILGSRGFALFVVFLLPYIFVWIHCGHASNRLCPPFQTPSRRRPRDCCIFTVHSLLWRWSSGKPLNLKTY